MICNSNGECDDKDSSAAPPSEPTETIPPPTSTSVTSTPSLPTLSSDPPCNTDEDCDSPLLCGNSGYCTSGPVCIWIGHCFGAVCKTSNDCDGQLVCNNSGDLGEYEGTCDFFTTKPVTAKPSSTEFSVPISDATSTPPSVVTTTSSTEPTTVPRPVTDKPIPIPQPPSGNGDYRTCATADWCSDFSKGTATFGTIFSDNTRFAVGRSYVRDPLGGSQTVMKIVYEAGSAGGPTQGNPVGGVLSIL